MGVFVCYLVISGEEEEKTSFFLSGKGRSLHDNLGVFQCPPGYMIVPQPSNQITRTLSPKRKK